MKIGIVGCGALGSYYGACLARSEQDVHLLLRSDLRVVSERGLRILSPRGNFHVRPNCAGSPEEIGPCDVVFIGLKTTANRHFGELLPPLVGPHTLLVTLQNGLGNEDQLAALFGGESILGGLCFVCLNRVAPGVIVHSAHGRIVLGEYQRRPQPRTHALANTIRNAGISCDVAEDLERAHWEKLVWNIPFNGLGVAAAAGFEAVWSGNVFPNVVTGRVMPTDLLLREERWSNLVRALMHEVIHTAQALGHPIPLSVADHQIERTRQMGSYKASTLIDFERGQPLELEGIFLAPAGEAARLGIDTPRLSALCQVLRALDPGKNPN